VRVVADTNTVVSGLLWHGNPRRVIEAARAGTLQLFTSAALLAEIEEVLQRPKFARRLSLAGTASHTLVMGYAALAWLIESAAIEPVIIADPDDDVVLACAVAARAEAIVSGDKHLLDLKQYEGMPILTAAQLLAQMEQAQGGAT
jgi:uncharacterized protein